ncbi:hypothetical protein GGR56DRAFT_605771 [Xylariaceae sp. FL0804]|nr:hypothetical protein GGR56DRAFT_605771 [Xylariaceae sp. FL0804]
MVAATEQGKNAASSQVKVELAFIGSALVVGAGSLDMAGLLALVADLLSSGRLLLAVSGEVTVLATVVAFATVHAFAWSTLTNEPHVGAKQLTRHMAIAAAGVAGLTAAATAAVAATATAEAATAVAVASVAGLGTVASDVAHLATLRSKPVRNHEIEECQELRTL